MRYEAQQTEFFVILSHSLPFYPTSNPKNENFEKMKKSLEISSFYTSAPKIMIICYTFTEIRCVTYFSFWSTFFNCYLAVPWPTLGHSQEDSLTNPMLITAFN